MPLSTVVRFSNKVAPLTINHQGQFPAVAISVNLAPGGTALGQAGERIQQRQRDLKTPITLDAMFQGMAQAFQSSLSSTPPSSRATSCSACSTRATSTRSQSCRPCPRPARRRKGVVDRLHRLLPRFRPIVMTTFAAIGGDLPVSQWLTLYTTPVICLYLDRFAH